MQKKILLLCALLVLLLCACQHTENAPLNTSAPSVEVPVATTAPAQTQPSVATTAEAPRETETAKKPAGKMVFTDDGNNKFIAAVVEKYGADPQRLACIYAVPEADNNHIFEFDGTTDSNGRLIRNADTLRYVYNISADCKTIARTGGRTGNDGLTLAQGVATFEVVKKFVLPKFAAELAG